MVFSAPLVSRSAHGTTAPVSPALRGGVLPLTGQPLLAFPSGPLRAGSFATAYLGASVGFASRGGMRESGLPLL